MNALKGKQLFSYFLLGFALSFIFMSFSLDPKTRLIPLGVALATFLLLVCVVINDIRPVPFIERLSRDLTEIYRTKGLPGRNEREAAGRKFFVFLGWISGFFLSILFFGFNISIVLFAFAFFKTEAGFSWTKSLLAAGLIWASIFVVFELALNFALFKGWIFGEVLPPL
jgi:tetrahydromethanopterin S-methyltransferase subunit F